MHGMRLEIVVHEPRNLGLRLSLRLLPSLCSAISSMRTNEEDCIEAMVMLIVKDGSLKHLTKKADSPRTSAQPLPVARMRTPTTIATRTADLETIFVEAAQRNHKSSYQDRSR